MAKQKKRKSPSASSKEMGFIPSQIAEVRGRKGWKVMFHERRGDGSDYSDYNLIAAVVLLTCFGLVMLYSTSAYEAQVNYGSDTFYFAKQAFISLFSFAIMIGASCLDYHWYIKKSGLLYVVSMGLLVATKFLGRTVNGARRWIYIGPLSFQPAEIAKLAVILFIPYMLIHMGRRMKGWKAPAVIMAFGGGAAFFTYYFTENLSTGLIILGITVVMLFIVHPATKQFLGLFFILAGFVAIAGAVVISKVTADTSSFRLRRIMVWLDPEAYSKEGGYQVIQGLYAIGSGGFFGKGLGNSTQKLGALPEAQNDMIFSIICEELGVFGAVIVIGLFVFLLYRLFFIAQNAPDLLGSLIAIGIFTHISLQVVLNIAVVLNVIPTTGITLPFVSYGGTSILFLMLEMSVAISVSREIQLK